MNRIYFLIILLTIFTIQTSSFAEELKGKRFSCINRNIKNVVIDYFWHQIPGYFELNGEFISNTEVKITINALIHSSIDITDEIKCNLTNKVININKITGSNEWKGASISMKILNSGTVENLVYDYAPSETVFPTDIGSCHIAVDSMKIASIDLSWLPLLLD